MRNTVAVLTLGIAGIWLMGEASAWAQAPSLRSSKRSAVSFRLATTTPTRGFQMVSTGRGNMLYVAPRAALSRADVASAETKTVPNGTDVVLSLTNESAERLAGMMRKHDIDRLALFSGGRFQAAGVLEVDAADGRAVVSGLSAAQAQRFSRLIGEDVTASRGPVISLVPSQSQVQPGGTLAVDVFMANASNLRTYQVSLDVSGGDQGEFTVTDVGIDDARNDFIFGSLEKLDAADVYGRRFGAVLFQGGVDAARGYLGTFTLSASPDASGTFQIKARHDASTIVWSSDNKPIAYSVAPPVNVTVIERSRISPTDR